jgi:hypothetical protein
LVDEMNRITVTYSPYIRIVLDTYVLNKASLVQSAYRLGYGLDDGASIPGKGNDGIFSLRHRVQTSSGAHQASYPMGTGALTPGGNVAVA